MIVPPTVGPLWGSEIQPELRFCRETSGEHCNLSLTSCVCDCPAYCWPSLGLGNTAGAEILPTLVPTVWPVCLSVCLSTLVPTVWPVLARLPPPSLPPCKCRNAYTPNAGSPLCGIPQSSNFVASRRVPTLLHPFGEHCNLSLTSCVYDCPAYCWPSLGLGNTAGAEILQGDVWRALQSVTDIVRL